MKFLENKDNNNEIECFSQSEDQIYAQIFESLIFDFYFVEKKRKSNFFFFIDFFMNYFIDFSFVALLILGITFVFQRVGLFPKRAEASPLPTSNFGITLQYRSSEKGGFTISGKDNIYKNSNRVVVAGLQPRTTNRVLRGPFTFSSMIRSRSVSHKVYTSTQSHKIYTSTQRGIETKFGLNFVRIVNNNQVLQITTMQLERVPVEITNRVLIANKNFSTDKNIFVETKVEKLAKKVDGDPRLSKINKYLNVEGWQLINDVPTLVFNFDASHGRHYQNKILSSVVKDILYIFLKENSDLDTSLLFRESESEHPIQTHTLEGVKLNREDAHSYQLSPEAHATKTSEVDLRLPSTVETISDSFTFYGEATIDLLQSLWDKGKLTNSVESMNTFKHAVRECIKADIADFKETGLPETLDSPGQIKSSIIGEKDCTNFAEILLKNDVSKFKEDKCVKIIKDCVKDSIVRAAYINQGLNQFTVDSPLYKYQLFHSTHYVQRFKELIDIGMECFPSLSTDQQFLKDYTTVINALNGKGDYADIIQGKEFAEFRNQLNDPQSRINLIPRTAKNYIFKNKK